MTESELREGLVKVLLSAQILFTHERAAINLIDDLVGCIRQHDGHAEFVRAVKEAALDAIDYSLPDSAHRCAAKTAKIIRLCDAERRKEE